MSLLSNFGQGLQNGGAGGFGTGLQQGLSMVQNAQQIKAQKREREWQKDMTMVKTYIDYAGTKGVTPDTSSQSINQANQIINKWYPNMKLPQLTPQTIGDYKEVLTAGQGLISTLEKDPSKFEFVIGEWGKANAAWDANNLKQAELTEMQKQARQGVTDTLKNMGDSTHKRTGGGAEGMTPDKARKRMTELKVEAAKLGKVNAEQAQIAKLTGDKVENLQISKEDMAGTLAAMTKEMAALNQHLPENERLVPITPDEAAVMREAGVPDQEIFQRSYIDFTATPKPKKK